MPIFCPINYSSFTWKQQYLVSVSFVKQLYCSLPILGYICNTPVLNIVFILFSDVYICGRIAGQQILYPQLIYQLHLVVLQPVKKCILLNNRILYVTSIWEQGAKYEIAKFKCLTFLGANKFLNHPVMFNIPPYIIPSKCCSLLNSLHASDLV